MADESMTLSPPDSKKPWASKIFVLNLLLAVLGVIQVFWPGALGIENWLHGNDAIIAMVWGGLNAVLRLITKDKISLTD